MENKQSKKDQKTTLHSRSKHHGRYDLNALTQSNPDLKKFVAVNKYGNESVDFFNPLAVKALNKSLLLHHYGLSFWDIPEGYLCPPIPGRADYIHNIADVLALANDKVIPTGSNIKCLDIGVGANCIYPIIGNHEYGWSFIGTDIDEKALANTDKIIASNPSLSDNVETRFQKNPYHIFKNILKENEQVDIVICNPPFHSSMEEAHKGSIRKLSNLKNKKVSKASLNFGGQEGELWTKGGEKYFIGRMIDESVKFSKKSMYFSTLISKKSNLQPIYLMLKEAGIESFSTIPMGQGNKITRILVWSFLDKKERSGWAHSRWSM